LSYLSASLLLNKDQISPVDDFKIEKKEIRKSEIDESRKA
jgi:hypothetical protein